MSKISRIALGIVACVVVVGPSQGQTTTAPAPKPDCAKMMANMDHAATGQMDHAAMIKDCPMAMPAGDKMAMPMAGKMPKNMVPTMPAQAAFGAIGEIVRLLEADPATDWSKVNLEALRQHFIDMDEVTMRSRIVQHQVAGGFVADLTGPTATSGAIRRMLPGHAKMFESSPEFDAKVAMIPSGARLTLLAHDPTDSAMVARVRGLGAIGFLTEGEHHAGHHLAIARGESMAHMH